MTAPPVLTRFADYVHKYAAEAPEREAVVFGDERTSYAELESRVVRCAKALLAAGVGHGDRVAMLCTSRPEYFVVCLASMAIGAVWLGLNPKYRLDEYRHVVGDSQPRIIFSMSAFEGREYADDLSTLRAEYPCIERLIAVTGAMDGAEPMASFLSAADGVADGDYRAAAEAVDRLDPALLVYTSGTTGKPKGALLSHHGLCWGSVLQTTHFKLEHPKMVVNFPIDHVACVADTCGTTLVKGGTIIFQERFDPAATLDALVAEKSPMWGGVPTMIQMALALPNFDDYDLSGVECILWAGAAMPRDGIEALRKIGARLLSAYGMTETSCHVTYTDDDADLEVLAETIGRPDPRCPCRIVNDDGRECAVGEPGELEFKGEYLMLGYHNRPQANAETFTGDGWMRTGDIGYWREDGNIKLVGRKSEMFKSGGYNVYPREVEIALESHAAVAMAAVIGVPDPIFQEVGHAYILRQPGQAVSAEDLKAYCRERLANYKIPKKFIVADELPRLPVGKVDKKALRESALADSA